MTAHQRAVGLLPDVTVGAFTLRDVRALPDAEARRAQWFLRDALKYFPIAQTCNVPSDDWIFNEVAVESNQVTRLNQVRTLRTSLFEREGDVKPKAFAVLNAGGRLVGAFEWSAIRVVAETAQRIFLVGRSYPAFQMLLTGNATQKASYVPWISAHTTAIRAFMQAEFPGPDGKIAKIAGVEVRSDTSTGNPLMLAFEDEIARLVTQGIVTVVTSTDPLIPEVVVRIISPV